MKKIGNNTNIADASDMKNPAGASYKGGHRGGRRTSIGASTSAGGPGAKEKSMREGRPLNIGGKGKFRSGSQDARVGGDMPGPASPSALQLKTRRRGDGAKMATPPASMS